MKFNKIQGVVWKLAMHQDATVNHEGALAFRMDPKTELLIRVLTALIGENKFYETSKQADDELTAAIRQVLDTDPEFVLKLAAFARNEMQLRSVPLLLLREYADSDVTLAGSRRYVPMCIRRADEITELIAASLQTRQKLPQFIKNGLRPCFNRFDAYQYAKYNREGAVTFKDAIFLCHPKADTDERQAIFDKIIEGTLEAPDTWEVALSTRGASKETWESVTPRMGYMAMMRNLNNFLKHDVDLEPVIKMLTDPAQVRKSKQLPFRYFSAYRTVQSGKFTGDGVSRLLDALNMAIELSIENISTIPGRTLLLVDVSGSMSRPISRNSSVSAMDIACMFGALASRICESADVVLFAEQFHPVSFSSTTRTLDRMEKIRTIFVGGATFAHLPMGHVRQEKIMYDRLMMFSDMQCYNSNGFDKDGSFAKEFLGYQHSVNPNAILYSVDLMGYGTTQVPQDVRNVHLLAGWSERIFDYVRYAETDSSSIVQVIENYNGNG